MKKIALYFTLLVIAIVFIGTAVFLFKKSQEKPIVYETQTPQVTTIIKKTVATGKVIPRKEVNVTSQVSGVVNHLFVTAGETVTKGDLLAKITLAPNMVALNNAESKLEAARINLENAEAELKRQKALFNDKLISASEYNKFLLTYNLQQEAVQSSENNLLLIREGATKKSNLVSNEIRATVNGMILDVPNKEGAFIVESSTYGAGSTVATLADMTDMIFEGTVDEAEVGKIKEGMPLLLNIGALEGEPFDAVLEYISPKGVEDQGAIKFQIRAAVTLNQQQFLRANYSANADIILEQKDNVLAINEGDLLFEDDKHFVEIETAPQHFEKREITTGISDGINIEVSQGLTEADKVKKQKQ